MSWVFLTVMLLIFVVGGGGLAIWWWRIGAKVLPYEDEKQRDVDSKRHDRDRVVVIRTDAAASPPAPSPPTGGPAQRHAPPGT